jgi:hypothetical protein
MGVQLVPYMVTYFTGNFNLWGEVTLLWSCPRCYLTFLKSGFCCCCFTVSLIISHYLPHCLSLSPFLSLPSWQFLLMFPPYFYVKLKHTHDFPYSFASSWFMILFSYQSLPLQYSCIPNPIHVECPLKL